jgi:hypothetical protein
VYRSPARPRESRSARRYPAQAAILFSSLPWRTPRPPACLLPWETQCTAAPTPRPAKLKLLNGVSPGRDSGGRLDIPTPNFERGCREPPADLGAEALLKWERITLGLDRLGLLEPEDLAPLVQHRQTGQTYITPIPQAHAERVTVTNP